MAVQNFLSMFSLMNLNNIQVDNQENRASQTDEKVKAAADKQRKERNRLKSINHDKLSAFAKVSHTFRHGWCKFGSNRLDAMTKYLEEGFKQCKTEDKFFFDKWALEILPGGLKGLRKRERRKAWEDKSTNIIWSKTELYKSNPGDLVSVVNAIRSNIITPKAGKSILREHFYFREKAFTIPELIKKFHEDPNFKPSPIDEVRKAVENFVKNIEFYYLKENIEEIFNSYLYNNPNKEIRAIRRNCRQTRQDIVKIIEQNNIVNLIQSIQSIDENNIEAVKQAKEDLRQLSEKIQFNPRYYKTNPNSIYETLEKCIQKNPKTRDLTTRVKYYSSSESSFFIEPIIKSLKYKSTKTIVLNEFIKALNIK